MASGFGDIAFKALESTLLNGMSGAQNPTQSFMAAVPPLSPAPRQEVMSYSDIEPAYYERKLPMEGRATFLPFRDTMEGSVFNERQLAVPGVLAELMNAFTAPARSMTDPTFNAGEEAAGMAMNVGGSGLAVSRAMRSPTGQGGFDLGMSTYKGSHTAPNANSYGATLDDLTKIMPKNVYTREGKNLYGLGDPVIDREWWMTAMKAQGKPDYEVEVFRAVPKGIKDINSGDWVTTSKKYAENHGESALSGDYDIISKKVKAKTLSTAGDPQEYGYNAAFDIVRSNASEIFGKGAERIRYTDPTSGGFIDVLLKPDGTASVMGLEVPKEFRGTGIGKELQSKVLNDFPMMGGQVSSKAAATNAYKLGRRPVGKPNATLDEVLKTIDEDSSVNLVSPEMQKMFTE